MDSNYNQSSILNPFICRILLIIDLFDVEIVNDHAIKQLLYVLLVNYVIVIAPSRMGYTQISAHGGNLGDVFETIEPLGEIVSNIP